MRQVVFTGKVSKLPRPTVRRPSEMIFEVGKYYQHIYGHKLFVLGELETTMYGKTLMAETDEIYRVFRAVGRDADSALNYHEISREDWMKSFSQTE
jgi:hypothetical protein